MGLGGVPERGLVVGEPLFECVRGEAIVVLRATCCGDSALVDTVRGITFLLQGQSCGFQQLQCNPSPFWCLNQSPSCCDAGDNTTNVVEFE